MQPEDGVLLPRHLPPLRPILLHPHADSLALGSGHAFALTLAGSRSSGCLLLLRSRGPTRLPAPANGRFFRPRQLLQVASSRVPNLRELFCNRLALAEPILCLRLRGAQQATEV